MVRVLVLGGSGLVGSRFLEVLSSKLDIKAPQTSSLDILNKNKLLEIAQDFKPDFIINFAAYTDVQGAQEQNDDENGSCYQINAVGAKNVAEVCKKIDANLIQISTDYVFDGEKSFAPYTEEDKPDPKNWYGKTKYFGEQYVLQSGCKFVIVRISMPFSSHYDLKVDIARNFLGNLRERIEIKAITDQKVTPVFVGDVANSLYEIIKKEALGIYHVVSTNWTTPFDFAKLIAQSFNLDESLIKPITLDEYNRDKRAKILRYSWLDPAKFIKEFGENILHTVEEDVETFKQMVDELNQNPL